MKYMPHDTVNYTNKISKIKYTIIEDKLYLMAMFKQKFIFDKKLH